MRRPVSTKGAELAQKPFVGEGCRGSHEQGNGRDLILVFLKTWRITLKFDSDHTCYGLKKGEKILKKIWNQDGGGDHSGCGMKQPGEADTFQ